MLAPCVTDQSRLLNTQNENILDFIREIEVSREAIRRETYLPVDTSEASHLPFFIVVGAVIDVHARHRQVNIRDHEVVLLGSGSMGTKDELVHGIVFALLGLHRGKPLDREALRREHRLKQKGGIGEGR